MPPPPITEDDLLARFGYHAATAEVVGEMDACRRDFLRLARDVVRWTPTSREQSLAITALEEAQMWAIKSLALTTPVFHPGTPESQAVRVPLANDADREQ